MTIRKGCLRYFNFKFLSNKTSHKEKERQRETKGQRLDFTIKIILMKMMFRAWLLLHLSYVEKFLDS